MLLEIKKKDMHGLIQTSGRPFLDLLRSKGLRVISSGGHLVLVDKGGTTIRKIMGIRKVTGKDAFRPVSGQVFRKGVYEFKVS